MSISARGRRIKGMNYQRDVCKKIADFYDLDWKEHIQSTPQSGGMGFFPGDIQKSGYFKDKFPFHIECKNHAKVKVWEFIEQAESEAPEGETPVVIFHKPNTSKDYVILSLDAFLELTKKANGAV